jgi:IS4 transposase
MKKGTVYEVLSEKNWKNISDKRIRLSNGLELRLIQIKTEDGIGEYLTNIFDLSAMDIVHAYEQRWIIEIFFREIKSYFKIDHFMSKNLNGMLIQIFCTLTAYALMVLFRVIYDLYWISILEIKRYLKYNIIEGNLHGLKCSNNAIV